jgi:TolB-like protein
LADIFLSYARADQARVEPLVTALQAEGWSVWWDPEIAPGEEFDRRISEALDAATTVVVVWTPASVESRWVRAEAREAAERGVLIPIRFEQARPPIDARALHTTDMDDWGENAASRPFQDLARAVRGLTGGPVPVMATAPTATGPSLAVLPFVNMSSDPEQEYFSDGLSEELINQLAQIRGLKVAGRTSSFAFKGRTEDLRLIGQRLGVEHVLEGSVRKAGSRLRVTAQLIKVSDGYHLWSQAFDRELDDVFAIQDDIARAVAGALAITLGVGEGAERPGGTQNVEAWDLMLRARTIIRRHNSAKRAIEVLQAALEIDPNFALAWNVLGNALTSLYVNRPDPGTRAQIDAALGQSVRLAPDLWTAHEARANQLELRHDWVEAEKANVRSRALAPPSMREPLVSRCHQLAIVGRVSEAIPFGREALRVEPLAPTMMACLLDLTGRPVEAEAHYQQEREMGHAGFIEGAFALHRRLLADDHGGAKAILEELAQASVPYQGWLREFLQVFDDRTTTRALIVRGLKNAGEDKRVANLGLFLTPLGACFGESDLALEALRKAGPSMVGVQITTLWHPLFAPMRRLPGFKDLLRELNLETYWRATGQWGEFVRPLGDGDFEVIR